MKCSIDKQKQLIEAAKIEYRRLEDLQKQGYEEDLENGILDIQEAMNNMRAIIYKKPENIVVSEVQQVDEMFINELNRNNPKDGKVKIQILSGVKTDKGKIVYTVQYPNNPKKYKLPATRITADQMDANNIYGSDENTGIGDSKSDVLLGSEELNLGEVLREEFNNYYGIDLENGLDIKSQEFADLQNDIIDTYEKTMQDLGTGELKISMFENMEKQTAGQINLRTNEMQIRWNKMSRLSRLSEIFLHEINHKMSAHVFRENMKLRRLMEDLRQEAINSGIDYKVYLEGIENPTKEEIEIAKMKFKYTFDKTANVEEFYAYATTNENVYNAIKNLEVKTQLIKELKMEPGKRNTFAKVMNILIKEVNRLWRLLSGRGVRGGQMIADMVATIARIDAETQQRKWAEENGPEGLTDLARTKINQLDEAIEPAVKQVGEWVDKLSNASTGKLVSQIKKIPILNDLIETGITQYLWRAVTQDTTTENVADMYMVFRHSKQVIEKHTADIRNGVKMVATDLYKDVDEPIKNAVTRILLEADLAQFTVDEIKGLLGDNKAIEAEMNRLENIINNADKLAPNKTIKVQMEGLAEYLVSGKTVVHNQQINAYNIASNLMGKDKHIPSERLVSAIDKWVTLKALTMSDETQVRLLKELVNSESGIDIVDKTIKMYRGYIDNMVKDATIDGYNPIQKGFTRAQENLLRYELIPEYEVETQEKVLMKKVSEKPHAIVGGVKYYLMTGRTKSVGFNEGALGLISHTIEGIPVSSLIRKNNESKKFQLSDYDLRQLTKETIEKINLQEDVEFKMVEGTTLVPVYNHKKEIVDYRIQLNKLEKEIHLPDRETALEDILSNTFSRSVKTSLTATENKKVVDQIIANGHGVLERPDDYVLIEEYTEEDRANGVKREKRHDRWDYLPDHTKEYIYDKLGYKGILIHKDFVELMTGEKEVTIGNFTKWGFDIKKYPQARARLMALEAYIAEILSYVKQAMVVLNADVLLGNTVSNAMVAMTHGVDPIEYSKKFKERWKQLNDYNEKMQMLAELEVRQMAGEDVAVKIKQLKRQLEGNVWDELVKDGQYTALVEDINVDQKMDGQLMQQMQKYIDKTQFGGIIKTVKNMLYIDKTSALYNTMLKTVHYGDAITRQIIKEELEKKAIKREGKITPKIEREILNYLDQLLVNYGYTMNRWWKYAERVGGLFFMRYYMGQGKAIVSMAKRSPTRTALLQGTQKLTGIDIADPIDTYTNSGIDGLGYRMMFDDAPGLILEPNIFDLIPDMSSFLTIR